MTKVQSLNFKDPAFAPAVEEHIKEKVALPPEISKPFSNYGRVLRDLYAALNYNGDEQVYTLPEPEYDAWVAKVQAHTHRAPIEYLAMKLFEIDLSADGRKQQAHSIQSITTTAQTPHDDRPRDASTQALDIIPQPKDILIQLSVEAEGQDLEHEAWARGVADLIGWLQATERKRLEIQLYLGAAMVLVRLKARRLLKDKADELLASFDEALESALGKSGKALLTESYRICAAYRYAMTMFLSEGRDTEIPDLKPAAHAELKKFNDRAIPKISEFLRKYDEGKIPHAWISGMPNISKASALAIKGSGNSSGKKSTAHEADARRARSLLSGPVEMFVAKFEKKVLKEKKLIVESAFLGYGNMTDFFEKVDQSLINEHRDDIIALSKRLLQLAGQSPSEKETIQHHGNVNEVVDELPLLERENT